MACKCRFIKLTLFFIFVTIALHPKLSISQQNPSDQQLLKFVKASLKQREEQFLHLITVWKIVQRTEGDPTLRNPEDIQRAIEQEEKRKGLKPSQIKLSIERRAKEQILQSAWYVEGRGNYLLLKEGMIDYILKNFEKLTGKSTPQNYPMETYYWIFPRKFILMSSQEALYFRPELKEEDIGVTVAPLYWIPEHPLIYITILGLNPIPWLKEDSIKVTEKQDNLVAIEGIWHSSEKVGVHPKDPQSMKILSTKLFLVLDKSKGMAIVEGKMEYERCGECKKSYQWIKINGWQKVGLVWLPKTVVRHTELPTYFPSKQGIPLTISFDLQKAKYITNPDSSFYLPSGYIYDKRLFDERGEEKVVRYRFKKVGKGYMGRFPDFKELEKLFQQQEAREEQVRRYIALLTRRPLWHWVGPIGLIVFGIVWLLRTIRKAKKI